MPLFRVIAVALLIWIAYVVLKGFLRKARLEQSKKTFPPNESEEKMVQCNHCGVHLPQHLAVKKHDNHYYCPEHSHSI